MALLEVLFSCVKTHSSSLVCLWCLALVPMVPILVNIYLHALSALQEVQFGGGLEFEPQHHYRLTR